MTKLKFYIVDVFATKKYTGNQLAVFPNANLLSSREMQEIAREINYSETTFVLGNHPGDGGYEVRIFTPTRELPFAGHPILGTAYVIQQEFPKPDVKTINLKLKVGNISVTQQQDGELNSLWWMQQNQPEFLQQIELNSLAEVLNLATEEIDCRYPIQEVSTGLPFIIVPLKNYQALKKIKIDSSKYAALIKNTQAQAILVFCPETKLGENHLSVRVFAEFLGVPEDPATGSANGCLASYLCKYSYLGNEPINIRVEQGYEIGRPSLLLLKSHKNEGEIEVFVGGKVLMVAKGVFI